MLGSIRLITNQEGAAAARYDYRPFGEEIPVPNPAITGSRSSPLCGTPKCYGQFDSVEQMFSGKERDNETNLDYLGARYLSNTQGRFTSPDPMNLGSRIRYPQTWNMYSYTLNNPVRYVDPSGRWSTEIHNRIIDTSFPGLSSAGRDVLKGVSAHQDRLIPGQSRDLSFQHSMRAPWETPAQAQERLQQFAKERLEAAQILNTGNTSSEVTIDALKAFGELLHAEVDGTSPAHEGFQVWEWNCVFAWMGCAGNSVMQHKSLESTITPQRMEHAITVAQMWFLYTFGDTQYVKATTDPEANRKKGQATCLKDRETGQCVQ
jgi:RHS repeat-associated protein